ncbi:MAG: sigma-54 interaction domain-containing protein [Candidatus Eiseniibacteriota bacterium]
MLTPTTITRYRALAPPEAPYDSGCERDTLDPHDPLDPHAPEGLIDAPGPAISPGVRRAADALELLPRTGAEPGEATMVGRSSVALEVQRMIERVAATDTTVLVRGESGVGKELVARELHRRSTRSRHPLIVVDCASLHDNLLQSELFGHERGAYTGAIRLKHGLFELADRGTIFLDEIGELTPELQVKLLRVLESGVFRRLGGTVDIQVNVRVVAATNRPLELLMKEGRFREDLFYRLNVFPIDVPPLRERSEDIPSLAEHFIRHSALSTKRSTRIGPAAMDLLLRYPWPGNVRELENAIERALILCDDGVIETAHLPVHPDLAAALAQGLPPSRLATLEEVELRHVAMVLKSCNGHRRRAAEILGISERSLYRMLKRDSGSVFD